MYIQNGYFIYYSEIHIVYVKLHGQMHTLKILCFINNDQE